jgi:superfamily II DNA or RNA helicase
MEPASALHSMPFRKNPRVGQQQVFDALAHHRDILNVKLPTGYGKTFTCCGVFSLLKRAGRVNRLLVIFPRDAQLDQFIKDAPNDDLPQANVDGPLNVVDLRSVGWGAIRDHRNNARQIFVTTIQSLIQQFGRSLVTELLKTGQWMICVDEHHHYGEDKTWGQAVRSLSRAFLLVLSATPHRSLKDGAFGQAHVEISYRDARDERAVKPLLGYAYHYELDLEEAGVIRRLTTQDLVQAAGGDDPDKIEKLRIERKMRWAPKYASPLISNPIDRMRAERLTSGRKLQALFTAMCVSHAEYVCEQIRDMYPELSVDWVGTGDFGRDLETNRAVLTKFCPPKDADGRRPDPDLDVLVHVGIAGEGLDSILVSEVVHLASAGLNNRTNQINGRASRYLPGVTGHISFDASCELAEKKYLGEAIMDAMDCAPPTRTEKPPSDDDDYWPPEPPIEPTIHIDNIKFVGIDSGDAGVQAFARLMQQDQPGKYDLDEMNRNAQDPRWAQIIDSYRTMRQVEAEQHNDSAVLGQWTDAVNTLSGQVTGIVVKLLRREGQLVDRFVIGKIKHRINDRKQRAHGEFNKSNRHVDTAKAHYGWLKSLDHELRQQGIPEWLRF